MVEFPSYLITLTGIVFSLLLAGNIFFVKRLVERIDETACAVQKVQIDVAVLRERVSNQT